MTTRGPPINNNNILFHTEVSLPHLVEQVLFATFLMSFGWRVFEFPLPKIGNMQKSKKDEPYVGEVLMMSMC